MAAITTGDKSHFFSAGVREHGSREALGLDTRFYSGSVSKQFVAMAVALLAERGELRFEDPVSQWIPELGAHTEGVTLRHLIHHTSGIRDYLGLATASGRDWSDNFTNVEALETVLADTVLNFPPGLRHSYSNSGYLLLAEVVKRVAGVTFAEFARVEILESLGMSDSHFHDDLNHQISKLAVGHRRVGAGWQAWPLNFSAVGSGGLYTTIRDLAKWNRNWLGNRLGSGQPLIDTLEQRGVLNSGATIEYAMGVAHEEHRGTGVVGHTGALAGYRAAVIQLQDLDASVALLCNHAEADSKAISLALFDAFVADAEP